MRQWTDRIMKPHVIPGSIFLIYGLEFHTLSFFKYVSAVQKARNRKKKLGYTKENGQKKKDIRTNNGLQKATTKLKI